MHLESNAKRRWAAEFKASSALLALRGPVGLSLLVSKRLKKNASEAVVLPRADRASSGWIAGVQRLRTPDFRRSAPLGHPDCFCLNTPLGSHLLTPSPSQV